MNSKFKREYAMISHQHAIKKAAAKGDTPVQKFYEGSVVLVTGGSGFLGKLLIEKLLRTCAPSKIYVLIRDKKGESPKERLVKVLEDPLFNELREERKNFNENIFPVLGDVSKIKLGLVDLDWKMLSKEVNVIFHLAANVKFDLELKAALLSNARGTREALHLAGDCTQLRAFVYVSTAYTHATSDRINATLFEVFYEVPVSSEALIKLAESSENLNEIKSTIADIWPNTYTFSKAIAEDIIRTNNMNLPICIVRPGIVTCTYRDPVPGWVDASCAYGPSGLILGVGLGILHVLYLDEEIKPNFVPADIVNNSIIVAAWDTAQRRIKEGEPPIIYTISSSRNTISYGKVMDEFYKKNIASTKAIWYNYAIVTKYKFIYTILTTFLHYVPAYIADFGFVFLRKSRMFVKIYNKVDKMAFALSYFCTSQWIFKDDNLQVLSKKLSPTDKFIYDMEITDVDWETKLHFWFLGARKYLAKDTQESMTPGYRKQRVLRIFHYLLSFLCMYIMWRMIQFCFKLFITFSDVL